eukprot:6086254-Pyramimonas_sp.AAC.1
MPSDPILSPHPANHWALRYFLGSQRSPLKHAGVQGPRGNANNVGDVGHVWAILIPSQVAHYEFDLLLTRYCLTH